MKAKKNYLNYFQNLIRKIKCWDARKKESEKNKLRKIMDTKRIREERNNSCAERRKEFLEEESERRKRPKIKR